MKGILIVPIGSIDSGILKDISDAVEKTFQVKAEIGKEISVPQNSYNPERKQYYSTLILDVMKVVRSKDFDRILYVADVDLYVPELNFVFGEADTISGIAVISLTRLREEFYGHHSDKKLLHERAVKEAIHELGHTYGFPHCADPDCVMYFSNTLSDTDRKGPGFCNNCKSGLNSLS